MSKLTTDRSDPRLGHGVDETPIEQHEAYLVLSEEERAKGFVRPVRNTYLHVGIAGPQYLLRDLTESELELYSDAGFIKYEEYPAGGSILGKFWTQEQIDSIGQGCQSSTTMAPEIAETYARTPGFYGSTYCCACKKHRPVGEDGEFIWEDGSRVGT